MIRRGAVPWVLAASSLLGAASLVGAQPSIRASVRGPSGDTLRSATPEWIVRASGVVAGDRPLTFVIEVGDRADFTGKSVLHDSTRLGLDSARFLVTHLVPPKTTLYWRARVRTATGVEAVSTVEGPRTSASWLKLIEPAGGAVLRSRKPTLRWSSARVTTPPGPWSYRVDIEDLGGRRSFTVSGITDTVFTPEVDLDANASYRWSVSANVHNGEPLPAIESSSFVIVNDDVPATTLLYQNFPNPFPSAASPTTCLWFDLHRDSQVSLEIIDLRGIQVKTIVPGPLASGVLAAGRYGRTDAPNGTGCDPRFVWDGRDRDGRTVPSGVYLARFRANGTEVVKKILFRGR